MYNFTKRNVIKLLYAMTRFTFIVITISLSLTGILRADDARSQNLKDVKVSLNFKNATLETIVGAIEKQTVFTFAYAKETGIHVPLSISAKEITLYDALKELASSGYLRFSQVNRMIKVSRKPILQKPGRIVGKITDDKGEVLPGASIKVKETGNVSQTAVDGTYALNLAPGTYTLEISYISFQAQQITGVVINEGKNTVLNIALKPASESLNLVTITSTFKKASIAGLFAQQQNRAVLSDGISAEQISATPDKHVGETLKRITGVSTTDNRKVVVRGIAERYNVALLNGSPLPSTDIQERDFEFNLIPTNLVENIVVSKSITPDMPYGFAGGLVQITTKSVPTNNFLSVTAGTSFNTRTTGKDFMGYQRGKYDYLGFDDGDRDHFPDGLILLPYGSDGFDPGTPDAERPVKAAQIAEQNKRIGGTERFGARTYQAMPSQNYQFNLGRVYSLSKTKVRNLGFVGSISYRNTQFNDNIVSTRRGDWSRKPTLVDDPEDINAGNVYGFNTNWGILLNGGLKTEKHQISVYNLYTRILDNQFTRITGWDNENPKFDDNAKLPKIREDDRPKFSDLIQNKLTGTHQLNRIKVEWNAARTHLKTLEQDAIGAVLRSRQTLNKYPLFEYLPNSVYNPEIGNLHRDQFLFKERNLSAEVSAAYDFKLGKTNHTFKAGGNLMSKHAGYDWIMLPIVSNSPDFYRMNIPVQDWGNYMGMEDGAQYLYYRPSKGSLNNFEGKSVNKGAFAMLDSRVLPNLRVVGGVRVDYFKLDTLKNANSETTLPPYYRVLLLDSIKTRWLPSVNITYTPVKNINVRASYGESVIRPGLMENAQFSRYSPNYGTEIRSQGVESTKVKNYDGKLEWFPGAGELLSVGYFYKYFDKPVEYSAYDPTNTFVYDVLISNSDWGKVKGWEFELRKSLGFIYDGLPLLNEIYVSGNLTLQQSTVRSRERHLDEDVNGKDSLSFSYIKYPRPLYGQIPRQYNLGIQYVGKRLGLNLVRNYMGYKTFLTGNDPNLIEYERPRAQLDAQISYKFLKGKMETKLNMSNLTDAPFRFFINDHTTYDVKPGSEGLQDLEWGDRYQYKEGFSEKFEEGYVGTVGGLTTQIGDRETFKRYIGRTFSFSVSYNF